MSPHQPAQQQRGCDAERLVRPVGRATCGPHAVRPQRRRLQREPADRRDPYRPAAQHRSQRRWRGKHDTPVHRALRSARARRRHATAPSSGATSASASHAAGSGVVGTSAPIARLLTPCGIGSGWSTARLGRGAHYMVDRDEARVLRQQAVAQPERDDRIALRVAALQRLFVGELADAMARPQVTQRNRLRVGRRRADDLAPRAARAVPFDHQVPGAAARATCRTASPGGRRARRATAPARRRIRRGPRSARAIASAPAHRSSCAAARLAPPRARASSR